MSDVRGYHPERRSRRGGRAGVAGGEGGAGVAELGRTDDLHVDDQGVDAFYVSIRGTTAEEVERLWTGLSDGATVRTAFGPAPWSPAYGMLTDRFGVTWVLDVAAQY